MKSSGLRDTSSSSNRRERDVSRSSRRSHQNQKQRWKSKERTVVRTYSKHQSPKRKRKSSKTSGRKERSEEIARSDKKRNEGNGEESCRRRISKHANRRALRRNSGDSKKRGWCSCFLCFILCCSAGCYIFCPPIPSQIVRKLAFHPPKKGFYYRLKYATDVGKEVEVTSAKQLYDKRRVIFEPQAKKDMEVFVKLAMQNSEVSIIKTHRNNYLVCVWFNSTYFSDKVILFSQANATDLGMFTQMDINFYDLSQLLETDVYGYDYSGYGYSTGTPSEKNLYADIQAVYEHIRSSRSNKKIILMGFSMGTAASIDLASKQVSNLAGVVLISPFTSGLRLIRSVPAQESTNCCDPFQSVDKAKLINVPTLLIHGEMDDIVPIQHSVELHKQLRKSVPPLYLDKATHSNVLCHEFPETINRIRKFIQKEI